MLCKIKSVAFIGLKVVEVTVEVSISAKGLPCFEIVGLPNKSVEESKHRVKSALINSGFEFPNSKIIVNLAPADLHKEGSFYDLPIAVGIYCCQNKVTLKDSLYFFGELSLDGTIKDTRGSYLAYIYVSKLAGAPDYEGEPYYKIVLPCDTLTTQLPQENPSAFVISVHHIKTLFPFLQGKALAICHKSTHPLQCQKSDVVNNALFEEIIGQYKAKRALEIAAAGGHHLMLLGPPGTGKTMLAKSIIPLLPDLTSAEISDVRQVYSYCGAELPQNKVRPFRSPHHTISYAGMVGGGPLVLPGEISLAHHGVLFMDEFCEFQRNVLESLRQPMQDKGITLSRKGQSYTFPANFMLIAAANPCPCGYLGHPKRECICTEAKILNYRKKLSGPIADRFDIYVNLSPDDRFLSEVSEYKMNKGQMAETKELISKAYAAQSARFRNEDKTFLNADMTNFAIKNFCKLDIQCQQLLKQAYTQLALSPRGYFKIIKVARTIADLALSEHIKIEHLAEAIQYRQL